MYLNKRKEKSMKKISVVLIAALVVSLLFGCGKSDDAKGTGKTTLSVWYWGEQEVPGYKAYSIYVGRNSGNGRCLERKRSSD